VAEYRTPLHALAQYGNPSAEQPGDRIVEAGYSPNDLQSMKRWLAIGGTLGLAFLVGQLAAWRQLVNAGVYLPSTLQSSFFYILTGLHGLHLLAGIVVLGIVLVMALKNRLSAVRHEPLKLFATYWHVMDALWIYLFLLLLLT